MTIPIRFAAGRDVQMGKELWGGLLRRKAYLIDVGDIRSNESFACVPPTSPTQVVREKALIKQLNILKTGSNIHFSL